MTTTQTTEKNKFLKLLIDEITKFLYPLQFIVEPLLDSDSPLTEDRKVQEVKSRLVRLMKNLGYDVYDQNFNLDSLASSVQGGLKDFFESDVTSQKEQLSQKMDNLNEQLGDFIEVFQLALQYGSSIYSLKTLFDAVSDPDFFDRLVQFLFFSYLHGNYPGFTSVLMILGIMELPKGEEVNEPTFLAPKMQFKNILDLLLDPLNYLKKRFKLEDLTTPDQAEEAALEIARALELLVQAYSGVSRKGLEGLITKNMPEDEQTQIMRQSFDLFFPIKFLTSHEDEDQRLLIQSSIGATFSLLSQRQGGPGLLVSPKGNLSIPNVPFKSFSLEDISFEGEGGTIFLKKGGVDFYGDTTTIKLGATVSKEGEADLENAGQNLPCILVGNQKGTRFSIQKVALRVETEFTPQRKDFAFLLDLDQIMIVLDAKDADSFLASILPSKPLEITADFAIGYSTKGGIGIQGGAGFRYSDTVNAQLGPILLESYAVELKASNEGVFFFGALSGSAELGPLTVSIGEIGFGFNSLFQKVEDQSRFNLALKPPTAIGLGIDAGMVKGGGYLQIDPPNYNGILSASFSGLFDITIIALVSTRLPGNKEGFSMLLSILAQFTPVQLGFGFALSGVGGLIGIHRKIKETELRVVVKNHQLDYILFPESPIKDANQIIQSLGKVFPAYENRFAFGLMGEVIWGGAVKLITIQIGLMFEFGGPFKMGLLGQLGMALPTAESPLVEINADIFGFFDSGAKTISIDSSIYDSRILIFELSGDIALRIFYGERADFLFSAGGFFPGFTPTIPVGKMKRLAISLKAKIVNISCENYVAVTSNSVQIGSAFRLEAKFGPFEVLGGAGFDALIQFNPFMFEVRFFAYLDIKIFGFSLIGVDLRMQLTGPNPFHFNGKIRLKLCFFIKITMRAKFTIGEKEPDEMPTVSPLQILVDEIKKVENWKTEVPPWTLSRVEMKDQKEIQNLFDPGGAFVFSEKAVPLDMTLERFAKVKANPNENHLEVKIKSQNSSFSQKKMYEDFAPAEFNEMSNAQKISAPAFEKYPSGKKFDQFNTISKYSALEIKHDRIIVNERPAEEVTLIKLKKKSSFLNASFQNHLAGVRGKKYFSSVEKSLKNIPSKVQVKDNQFTLASSQTRSGKLVRENQNGVSLKDMTYSEALKAKKGSSRPIVSVAGVSS